MWLGGYWIKHTTEVNTPIYIFYFYCKTILAEASNFYIEISLEPVFTLFTEADGNEKTQ